MLYLGIVGIINGLFGLLRPLGYQNLATDLFGLLPIAKPKVGSLLSIEEPKKNW